MTNLSDNSSLQELRARIDEIDHELVHLLKRRFEVTDRVGQYKKHHQLDAVDPDREREKYERFRQLCEGQGLDPEFGTDVLRLIMERVVQNHRRCREAAEPNGPDA